MKTKNDKIRTDLLKKENIDALAKAITHYAFRNGPVENMHANGQLSQSDMKALNKYMVNRLAGLFAAAANDEWPKLYTAFERYRLFYGSDWDAAAPDNKELDDIFESYMSLETKESDR